jgi:hypothetical protein
VPRRPRLEFVCGGPGSCCDRRLFHVKRCSALSSPVDLSQGPAMTAVVPILGDRSRVRRTFELVRVIQRVGASKRGLPSFQRVVQPAAADVGLAAARECSCISAAGTSLQIPMILMIDMGGGGDCPPDATDLLPHAKRIDPLPGRAAPSSLGGSCRGRSPCRGVRRMMIAASMSANRTWRA